MRTFAGLAACVLVCGVSFAGAAQTIESIAPLGVVRGQTTDVYLRGEGLGGFTDARLTGTGLVASGFSAEGDALIRVSVGVGDRAPLQLVDLTLEGSGELAVDDAFSVIAGPIELLTLAPAGAARGETIEVEFTGRNLDTVTAVSFGDGITVSGYSADSPVFATANVTITADAFSGPRPISLSRSGDVETVENAFSVAGGPLSIIDLDPEIGTRGQTATVSLQGNNLDTLRSVSFGPRIDVRNLEIISPRIAEATIEVRDDAAVGPRAVDWTSATASGSVGGKFAVRAGAMSVTRLRPTTGAQGSTVALSIEGFNLDGISAVDAGAGVTVGTIDSRFAGVASVELEIDRDAPVGYRDLEITGTNGVVALADAFYVSDYVAPPIALVFDSPVVLGNAQVGARTTGAFYIENAGTIDEIVTVGPATGDASIIRMIDPATGAFADSFEVEVAVDATTIVDVVFEPTVRTTNGISIPLTVRGGDDAGSIVVRGTGVSRELLLDPTCPLDFGVVDAGDDIDLPRVDTALSAPTVTGAVITSVSLESMAVGDVPVATPSDFMSFDLVRTIPGEGFDWGVTEITPVFSGSAGDYEGTILIETGRSNAPAFPCEFRLTVVGEVAEDVGSDDVGSSDAGPDVADDTTEVDTSEPDSSDATADADSDDTTPGDAAVDAATDVDDDVTPPGGGGEGCAAAGELPDRASCLLAGLVAIVALGRRKLARTPRKETP